MTLSSPSTFYLLGPTAVGKSALAAEVAARCGAEIVNADAFQLYDGLPILTACPEAALCDRVPHHLIGIVPPREPCDVGQFRKLALSAMRDIHARGRPAVIVGGTGLYIRALTRGLANLPSADAALRVKLEQHSLAQLQAMLREMDPASAASIDMQNRRRVARALEVCMLTGRSFTVFRKEWDAPVPHDVRGVIVMRPRAELFARIDERTRRMFASGVIDEVKRVGEIGPTAAQAIGYRQIRALLAGQCTEEECIREIQQATRRYAKRQITWLRKETHFARVDLTADAHVGEAIERCVTAIAAS